MMSAPVVPVQVEVSEPQPEAEEVKSSSSSKTKSEPSKHSKPCTFCHTPRDVLIRCQIDATKEWNFICPGKCWQKVSGGTPDGDVNHPLYRYGGMWKNKHEYVSAKIKGAAKKENRERLGGVKGEHRGKDGKEKRFKSEKDLPGVKGRGGVVEGVDDGVWDEDVSDLENESEVEESLRDEELDKGVKDELEESLQDKESDEDVRDELSRSI